jgi:hypothetical protein
MIGDFVIDVSLVECRALEAFQVRAVLLAALLEAPARRIVFRSELELYLSAAGGGEWSLDRLLRSRS